MWNRRKKSPPRSIRRRADRQARRLRLEALERRDCPAVLFDFVRGDEGGVLTITGDEEDNYIAMQSVGGGIQVALGDGSVRVFENVGDVVVNSLGGADTVDAPKFWVFGTELPRLQIHAGAGNDRVTIGDGEPILRRNLVTTHSIDAHVDLGEGADKLDFQIRNHDTVNVDVNSADSFDSVQVGVQYPLPHPIRLLDTRRATVDINLAGGGHSVDVQTQGVDVVDLNVVVYAGRATSDPSGNTIYVSASGGGVWRAAVELDGDGNLLAVNTTDVDHVELDATISGGSNTVQFVGSHTGGLVGIDFRPSCTIDLNFGAGGGNVVDVRTENIDEVTLNLLALGGNNVVKHELGHTLGLRHEHIRPEAHINFDLRGDGNQLGLNTQGYEQVDLDLDLTGNGNQVAVGMLLPAIQKVREAAARVSLEIDGTNNQGTVSNQGFGVWEVNLAKTLPGGDSTAAGTPQASSFLVTFDRPIDPARGGTPTGTVTFFIDGNPQVSGSDSFEVHGQGFGAATVDADTAGGNDSIWIDIGAPLRLALNTGDDEDNVRVDNKPLIWFSEGPAPIQSVSIDTGGGNDNVVVDSQAGDPFPFTRDGRSSGMVVDLGEGHDVAKLNTTGFLRNTLELTAGPGNDHVQAGAVSGRITAIAADPSDSEAICNLRVDLGDGNDVADITTQAFSDDSLTMSAGAGNDTVSADSFYGTGVYKSTDSGKTWTLDLGEGNDLLNLVSQEFYSVDTDIIAGEGQDTVELNTQWSSIPGRYLTLRPRPQSDETIDLGSGDDTLARHVVGYAATTTSIHAGDGDDTIVSNDSPASPSATPRPVLLVIANRDFYLGAGDDRLVLETSGYPQADDFIDAGDGDDNVQVRHRMFAIVDRTQLHIVIHLGAGSDSLQLETTGYRRISTASDTGPAGDGSDSIYASHQSQRRSTRTHNSRLSLDSGLDVYQHRAKGYRVQGPVQTPTSVEWVFVAY